MDSLKYGQFVWSIKLKHTQQVKPDILQLSRVLIDQLKVVPDGDQHSIEIFRAVPVVFDVLMVHWIVT